MYFQCIYCEYLVERDYDPVYVVCDWCAEYLEHGGSLKDESHWWATWQLPSRNYYQCFYCEYQVERDHDPQYCLCDWCEDHFEDGGTPNDVFHWWATWRWRYSIFGSIVRLCFPHQEEVCEIILGFLVGSWIAANSGRFLPLSNPQVVICWPVDEED